MRAATPDGPEQMLHVRGLIHCCSSHVRRSWNSVLQRAAGPYMLAQQRLPTIAPEQYTAEQKKAAEEFLAARKVPVFGPFEPMMHSHRRS
jgi:hypothetical protein